MSNPYWKCKLCGDEILGCNTTFGKIINEDKKLKEDGYSLDDNIIYFCPSCQNVSFDLEEISDFKK